MRMLLPIHFYINFPYKKLSPSTNTAYNFNFLCTPTYLCLVCRIVDNVQELMYTSAYPPQYVLGLCLFSIFTNEVPGGTINGIKCVRHLRGRYLKSNKPISTYGKLTLDCVPCMLADHCRFLINFF